MIKFGFEYSNYKSVRHNTTLYYTCILLIVILVIYFFFLPQSVKSMIAGLSIPKYLDLGIFLTLISIVSYVLIEIVKIHDHVYDKHFIRWRKFYDRDFIIPRLIGPFISNFNSMRFYEECNRNLPRFMEYLYYPYVGDDEERIRKHLITRFYERITIYWLIQMNELTLIASIMIFAILAIIEVGDLRGKFPTFFIVVATFYFLNWLWKISTIRKVENATLDEIRDIHDSNYEDLERRMTELCRDYNVPAINE